MARVKVYDDEGNLVDEEEQAPPPMGEIGSGRRRGAPGASVPYQTDPMTGQSRFESGEDLEPKGDASFERGKSLGKFLEAPAGLAKGVMELLGKLGSQGNSSNVLAQNLGLVPKQSPVDIYKQMVSDPATAQFVKAMQAKSGTEAAAHGVAGLAAPFGGPMMADLAEGAGADAGAGQYARGGGKAAALLAMLAGPKAGDAAGAAHGGLRTAASAIERNAPRMADAAIRDVAPAGANAAINRAVANYRKILEPAGKQSLIEAENSGVLKDMARNPSGVSLTRQGLADTEALRSRSTGTDTAFNRAQLTEAAAAGEASHGFNRAVPSMLQREAMKNAGRVAAGQVGGPAVAVPMAGWLLHDILTSTGARTGRATVYSKLAQILEGAGERAQGRITARNTPSQVWDDPGVAAPSEPPVLPTLPSKPQFPINNDLGPAEELSLHPPEELPAPPADASVPPPPEPPKKVPIGTARPLKARRAGVAPEVTARAPKVPGAAELKYSKILKESKRRGKVESKFDKVKGEVGAALPEMGTLTPDVSAPTPPAAAASQLPQRFETPVGNSAMLEDAMNEAGKQYRQAVMKGADPATRNYLKYQWKKAQAEFTDTLRRKNRLPPPPGRPVYPTPPPDPWYDMIDPKEHPTPEHMSIQDILKQMEEEG